MQIRSPFVHLGHLVQTRQAVGGFAAHDGGDIGQNPDDTNPESGLLDNGPGLDIFARLEGRKIVIAAHHRALDGSQPAGQFLQPVVEFVIPQAGAIIGQGIQHLHLDIAVQFRKIRSPLREIPRMQKEHVFRSVGRTDTVHKSRPFDHAAQAGIFPGFLRFHVAVGIIKMDDDKTGILGCTRPEKQAEKKTAKQTEKRFFQELFHTKEVTLTINISEYVHLFDIQSVYQQTPNSGHRARSHRLHSCPK